MNGNDQLYLPPKAIRRIPGPLKPAASACCLLHRLLRRAASLVMAAYSAASSSSLVRAARRSECGPTAGGARGPVAAAPGRQAGRHFGLWCTECSGVSLLPAARLDGLSCRSPVPMQGAEPPGATLLFAAAIRILSVRLAPGPASGGPRDGRLFCCPRGPRTGCSLKSDSCLSIYQHGWKHVRILSKSISFQ